MTSLCSLVRCRSSYLRIWCRSRRLRCLSASPPRFSWLSPSWWQVKSVIILSIQSLVVFLLSILDSTDVVWSNWSAFKQTCVINRSLKFRCSLVVCTVCTIIDFGTPLNYWLFFYSPAIDNSKRVQRRVVCVSVILRSLEQQLRFCSVLVCYEISLC